MTRSHGVDSSASTPPRHRPLEERAALRLENVWGHCDAIRQGHAIGWMGRRIDDAVGPVPVGRLHVPAFLRQITKHLLKQGSTQSSLI